MWRNYLNTALRNFTRYRQYSLINIIGLAIGMASAILIFSIIRGEFLFNTNNENLKKIYRINKCYSIDNEYKINQSTPYPLADAVKEQFPEIRNSAHFISTSGLIKYGEQVFRTPDIGYTSPSIFEIFTIPLKLGESSDLKLQTDEIVISESLARKFFGEKNPIGEILLINNRHEKVVTAVIEDTPVLSDYNFNCLMNVDNVAYEDDFDNWFSHWLETFILVEENTDISGLEVKISSLLQEKLEGERTTARLQSLWNIHFYSVEGDATILKYIYIFACVAVFVLVIACFNFMNLATAQAGRRTKEVGLRKISGADRIQLIIQFIGETLIYSFLALILSFFMVELALPHLEKLIGRQIGYDFFNLQMLIFSLAVCLTVGILSGIYPALVVSSSKPVIIFRSMQSGLRRKFNFRMVIVVVQFALAVSLLIATGIIYNQLSFMKNTDLGFDEENLLYLRLNGDISGKYETFKEQSLKVPGVLDISRCSSLPNQVWSIMRGLEWEGKEESEGSSFGFIAADPDFISTVKLDIIKGRDFSGELISDENSVIINEAAARQLGHEDPLGTWISDIDTRIIGVVKNFNSLPLNYDYEPVIILQEPEFYNYVILKITGDDLQGTISGLKKVWEGIAADFPFDYRFLDENFDRIYAAEIQAGRLFRIFAGLGIFIACLGLYGLTSFLTVQRRKEIGIRKVLGASVQRIVYILGRDFTRLVLIANLLAWPLTYFIMKLWLSNFVFRTKMNIWTFLAAGLLTVLISSLTISLQTVKAANCDPVKTLKYE